MGSNLPARVKRLEVTTAAVPCLACHGIMVTATLVKPTEPPRCRACGRPPRIWQCLIGVTMEEITGRCVARFIEGR
jgi:hypothetical protein